MATRYSLPDTRPEGHDPFMQSQRVALDPSYYDQGNPAHVAALTHPHHRIARAAGGVEPNFAPSFMERVYGGVRGVVRGAYFGWMTPGEPIREVVPSEPIRRRQYPVGYNYSYQPRAYEAVNFWQLKALSTSWDMLRAVIETRKDQISRLPSHFRVIAKPDEPPDHHARRNREDSRIPLLEDFFKRPDREHSFRAWQRAIIDQMLVTDATSILPRWRYDGHVYGFDVIDGATISPITDKQGRTPVPPDAAYRQVIHGIPMRNLMAMSPEQISDQLMYCPRNYRCDRFYGYPPVEQIMMTINIALRRQIHQLEFYTDGTVPDVFVEMPDGWSEDQIKEFELYWNSIMTGQTGERRKAKFLPAASKVAWAKDWKLKDEMDDYLIRIVCYVFGVSPTALVKMVNRASGTQMSDDAKMEGLEPVQMWFSEDIMNPIIQEYLGFKDIEHVFMDAVRSKPLEQAQINALYLDRNVVLVSEVRDGLGMDPLTQEQIDQEVRPAEPTQIEAASGAAGTKDKAGKTGAVGGGGKGKTGTAASPRSSARSTPKDKGQQPKGTDAGKVSS